MKAHEYLSNIQGYDAVLTNIRDEIDSLYVMAAGVSSPAYGSDKVQTSLTGDSPQEKNLAMIEREIRRYQDTYNHYLRLRKKVIGQINGMPDWRHRRILYLTYVKGWHSPMIADEMNYSCEHIRRMRTEALEDFEKLYLQET